MRLCPDGHGLRRLPAGSVEVSLKLMANGADSDCIAAHFECGNEAGASEGDDELLDPQQVVGGLLGQDDAVMGHGLLCGLPAASR